MTGRSPLFALALLVVVAVASAACGGSATDTTGPPATGPASSGPATTEPAVSTTTASGEQVFTLEDLAQHDGKDGRAAYVAVDGIVYDVSGSRMWPEGQHSACGLGAMAGRDLSETIQRAPRNMRTLIENMPVVGELAQ